MGTSFCKTAIMSLATTDLDIQFKQEYHLPRNSALQTDIEPWILPSCPVTDEGIRFINGKPPGDHMSFSAPWRVSCVSVMAKKQYPLGPH